LQAENAALRNQLCLYRKSGQRPRIRPADRLLWCFIAKFWVGWRSTLYFVQPRTVTTWQKKRFRDYWRALSQSAKPGRPRISRELRKLIGWMWEANPTWGSPKIVAELAMLGIDVAKSTVETYRPKRAGPPSPTWRTFLDQHVRDLVSIDFFIVPTAAFRVLFVFIVLAHDRRRRSLQRAASQETYVVISGLLPSLANTPVLGSRRTGRSSRTSSGTVQCC
jgi:hypothetical protein